MYFEKNKNQKMSGWREFPKNVIDNKLYRKHPIWTSVHMRTGKAKYFKSYPKEYLIDHEGNFFSANTDQNEMMWVLEKCNRKHKNTGFITYCYNRDASVKRENSYYNSKKFKKTGVYRYESINFIRLNRIYRYKLSKTVLIFSDKDFTDESLFNLCESINFKYKILLKNELIDGLNDKNLDVDFILFYNYSKITKELLKKLERHCKNIMINENKVRICNNRKILTSKNIYENYQKFNKENLFYKLLEKEFNLKYEKKDFGEYNELYKYSLIYDPNEISELNNIANHVYVINLEKNNEKFYKMLLKLKKLKIKAEFIRVELLKNNKKFMTLFNQIKSKDNLKIQNPGELGCKYSHLICLKDAIKMKYQKIAIFEDDLFFCKNFNENILKRKNLFENNDFVYFGASQWNWANIKLDNKLNFYKARRTCGTFGLYFKSNIFNILQNLIENYNFKIDITLWALYSKELKINNKKEELFKNKSIVLKPNLVIADVTTSDIREKQILPPEKRAIRMKWDLKLYNIE